MKKNLIYALVLATSMVACTEDYTDWAPAQQNEQEEAQTVTFAATPAEAIDIAAVEGDSVKLFTTEVAAAPGSVTTYDVTVFNADKTDSKQVIADEYAQVAVADLEAAINYLYGRRPVARTAEMEINAYTILNGQSVKTTATTTVTVTPQAPYISTTYYLIGAPSEWQPTCTTMPFTHSGKDVYDDPVFTVQFPVADGDTWFAFADDKTVSSGDWTMVYGCMEGNGNNGTEGKVARRNELTDDGSFKVTVAGDAKFVKFTINMMDQTYKIEKVNFADYIYTIGGSDWSNSIPMKHVDGMGNYLGFDYINSEFKFKPNADNWDGDFGQDPNADYGNLIVEGEVNCTTSQASYYAIKVNMATMTFELVPISNIGIIGTATPGGWDSDTDMTWDATLRAWTLTTDLAAGEMKFRANDDWAYNWGGEPNNATQNGANIAIAEAGNYTIVLTALCDGYATFTLTKN